MSTSPDKPASGPETIEAVKKAKITAWLARFHHFTLQADAACLQHRWEQEASFRHSATLTADAIFKLLGLTNAQTTSGEIPNSGGSLGTDRSQ